MKQIEGEHEEMSASKDKYGGRQWREKEVVSRREEEREVGN